jgi:hypothetical protein
MEPRGHRLLAGIGGVAVAGSLVLGQAGIAAAAPSLRASGTQAASPPPGATYKPVHKILKFGMHGPNITALQHRLHYLHYFVGKINGRFGWDLQEAVWAFKEVQWGREAPRHPNRVDAMTQHSLVHPRAPRVLFGRGGSLRIEINKKIEVLVLYKHNRVKLISHVSTAAWRRPDGVGWFTPGGFHRAIHYIPGKVADNSFGRSFMYWPVFFIGYTYAVHGFPNPKWHNRFYGVPLKPASHGCVRIPLDLSKILHSYLRIGPSGTPIWIYPATTPARQVRLLRPGHPG